MTRTALNDVSCKNPRKHRLVAAGLFVLVLTLTAGQALAQETGDGQQTDAANEEAAAFLVAVLSFEAGSKDFVEIAPQVTDLVHLHLSTSGGVELVERAQIDKILGELELGQSGVVSSDTAAKIGNLTGAQVLVTGRVFAVQNEVYVVAKVIGVETGKSFGEFVSFSFKASHDAGCQKLAGKIAASIMKKGSDFFFASAANNSSLLDSLMLMVEGKDLPTVSVVIDERHVGRRAMDPAAETEVSILLQRLGFQLVDADTTTTPPDIEIRGEAFSEFALRKGNLVSCKARVEVKAVERLTGKIIAIDRETDVVADISEQIAAKSAIQKAASTIAQRVVLRIVESLE